MKALFIGGVKSGKSRLAEAYILKHSKQKPCYLATTEFIDEELRQRIADHQQRRASQFVTIEAPLYLGDALRSCQTPVLVECVSMWLNNMMHYNMPDAMIFQELESVLHLSSDLVFVQNEVGLGIIPDNLLARRYVDISGKVAQLIASACDEVFFCCAGLPMRLK